MANGESAYSIFARFRDGRLLLRRGIRGVRETILLADRLRAGRQRERVFIVRVADGATFDEAEARRALGIGLDQRTG